MKMLFVSLGWLFIVILIWGLFYYMSIEKTIDYFNTELKKINNSVANKDYNEAQTNIIKVLERWRKTEKIWVYFVHQGDVDDIGASILKIDAYIKTENNSLILSEIEQLKKALRMVQGNESLSLENIF